VSIQVLRADTREVRPWKNGGGLTCEIAASPEHAGLSDFDWRVSMAVVEAAGPFSVFPGVDRLMLILEGRLELEIAGAERLFIDETAPAAEFPGDAVVTALAPAAPVTDINVMVRRGRFTASVERRRIEGGAAVVCQDMTLVVTRAGGLTAALGAQRCQLDEADAIRVDAARGALLRLRLATPDEVIVVHVNAVR